MHKKKVYVMIETVKINSLKGYENIKDYYSIIRIKDSVIFKNEKTGKTIKPFIKKDNGYLYIKLNTIDIHCKNIRINRIIAIAFIKTRNKFIDNLVVHHKDHNKQNNNINNLEWTTRKRNIFYYHYYKNFVPGQITMFDKKIMIINSFKKNA
jgi:hypothetical protein